MNSATENAILILENDSIFHANRPKSKKDLDEYSSKSIIDFKKYCQCKAHARSILELHSTSIDWTAVKKHFVELWKNETKENAVITHKENQIYEKAKIAEAQAREAWLKSQTSGNLVIPAEEHSVTISNLCSEVDIGLSSTCELYYKTLKNEDTTMSANNPTPIYEEKQYLKGTDMTLLSDDSLIAHIKSMEQEIKDLEKIETQSKKIKAKIALIKTAIAATVKVLDGRA